MTYIRDGDAFTYVVEVPPEPGLVAVGWLDAGMPFTRGELPAEFVDRLREKCRTPVRRTRGLYHCTFCPRPAETDWPPPTQIVNSEGGDFVVGSAEIRVEGPSGARYASPDMIIHYVEEHFYRPPVDFIAGVLREPSGAPSP
jgi:hypothetical protein